MKLNYLAFAVPLFLLFIGLEYYYSRRKGNFFFQYAESVANLNVGIGERLLDVFTTGIFFYVFDYIQRQVGLFTIRPAVFTWILLFFLTYLVWYWYHRLADEIKAFWAVHVVHLQNEDFNYTRRLVNWAGWNIFLLLPGIMAYIMLPIRNTWTRITAMC